MAAALGVGLAAAALGAWSLLVEPRRLRVERRTLRLPRWPEALDGLRVTVLADLHAGAPQIDEALLERIVDKAQAAGGDLVVALGDFVDHQVALARPVAPEAVARRIGRLAAPLGVFAVLGNHDWDYGGDRVRRALEAAGVHVLEDQVAAVRHRGARLWLAGVADEYSRVPDVEGTLAEVPTGEPVVVLTHSPDVFPRVLGRVALTLAGHAHGGQVDVPVVRGWVAPSRFGERYLCGHVEEGGRHLFVHPGIGSSLLPVRLGVVPRIVALTLVGEGRQAAEGRS